MDFYLSRRYGLVGGKVAQAVSAFLHYVSGT